MTVSTCCGGKSPHRRAPLAVTASALAPRARFLRTRLKETMNSIFWFGVVLGFIANIIASQCWELIARYRAWKAARKLVGTWVAYKINGRMVETTPMLGAGLTVVSAKGHWLSADSAVLNVRSQDIDIRSGETRDHDGHIVFDRVIPWLATRVFRYADSNEIGEQRLVIGPDSNIVYVFPVAAVATLGDVYGKHVWRRKGF